MIRPRPRFVRLRRVDHRDPTKRIAYVGTDLALRSLSALGLLALALAGWLLQARSQQEHEQLGKLDRESRAFLPSLRSLTELELACDDATNILADRHSAAFAGILSSRIRALAISVSVPASEASQQIELPNLHDPIVSVGQRGPFTIDVRTVALLLADLLRVRSIETSKKNSCTLIFARVYGQDRFRAGARRPEGQPRAILISPLGTLVRATPVNEQSIKLWRKWHGN